MSEEEIKKKLITREDVEKIVKECVADQFGKEPEYLSVEMNFIKDLKADSLDSVELIMQLEDAFEISIPDEEAQKIQTIGQAVEHICAKLKIK